MHSNSVHLGIILFVHCSTKTKESRTLHEGFNLSRDNDNGSKKIHESALHENDLC